MFMYQEGGCPDGGECGSVPGPHNWRNSRGLSAGASWLIIIIIVENGKEGEGGKGRRGGGREGGGGGGEEEKQAVIQPHHVPSTVIPYMNTHSLSKTP